MLNVDSDPAKRNIMGLIDKYPDVARNGIRLRRFGQKVISLLGGQASSRLGGARRCSRTPLSDENRSVIRRMPFRR